MSCFCKNLETTSDPKVNDIPRSFSDQPVMSLSGSDHRRSQRRPGKELNFNIVLIVRRYLDVPVSGTSVGLITLLICSMDCKSGLRPPCIHRIFSSMMAAIGKQLNTSVNVFQTLILCLRLPKIIRRVGTSLISFNWWTHIRHKIRICG